MSENKCPGQWKLDVNDRYKAAAGIVITLATASLTLPVFFLKDIAGLGTDRTIMSALSCSAYFGWGLLGISLLSGILYYYLSAKWVKHAWDKPGDILWIIAWDARNSEAEKNLEHGLDLTYFLLMTGFVVGLVFIGIFVLTFRIEPGQLKPPVTYPAVSGHFEFLKLELLPQFEPGYATLSKQIDAEICTIRQTTSNPTSVVAIVVGRHDQSELTSASKLRVQSNPALALQRAKAIESALRDYRLCNALPLSNVVAFDSTPRHIGTVVTSAELADDRKVEIQLFRHVP